MTNLVEYQIGTAPNNRDSEGDGMDDGWEVGFDLDPLADDSGADPDGDGYSNLEEFLLNLDPNRSDPPPVTPPPPPIPTPTPAPGGGGGGGSTGPLELMIGLYLASFVRHRRRGSCILPR